MKLKRTLKGIAVAAFTSATLGSLAYASLLKNDVQMSSEQSTEDMDFHGIPVHDAMIALYASYFSGADENGEFSLAMRADNTFGMNDALIENFAGENAPWIMLDSLSDGRNDSRVGNDMYGSHFIAAYHKAAKRIVITTPGMEYDYGPMDTLDDARQLISGSYEQTAALANYVRNIQNKIIDESFTGNNGEPLDIANDEPIIISHSLGSKPTHVMAMAGYPTVVLEPRPMTDGYLNDLEDLFESLDGLPMMREQTLNQLNTNTIDVRAAHANIWNSPLFPWIDVHVLPNSYIYGTGEPATLSDRHVAGDHAAEVFVPSIMRKIEPDSSAMQAPKGKDNMHVVRRTR